MIVTLCDLCGPDVAAHEQAAEPHSFTVDGLGPTVVDLCPTHYAEAVGPIAALLSEHGRRPNPEPAKTPAAPTRRGAVAPRPSDPDLRCLLCDHRARSAGSMDRHLRDHHGYVPPTSVYGPPVCPLCGHEAETQSGVAVHLGKGPTHPEVRTGNGILHTAWSMAMEQGDPHGVVAKRRGDLGL